MTSVYKKWRIRYTWKAQEELENLPLTIQKRIVKKMRFFASVDDIFEFAKSLKENKTGGYRLRIGDYRIVFDRIDNKNEIAVLKIKKRDEVYK